ncbi:hypothetical protein EET67_09880 [Pseudaminobacter arsenicus]|uniref:Major tail tube protein n=1 Tax=Borborobacter arsenicus TaxID=1851146 RepID=A0A432V6W0_9HYPH|nr:phage tail tube protein [Pseudaminobacter arsenicus]RUM97914.1 hypothetical protein EET67_09880 [Pseudaminobacter arsenicus]
MTDANRIRVTTVRETSLGETPTTPRMRTARLTGESLQYAPQFVQSQEIRDDRMNADPVKINETNQGAINFELSFPVDDSPMSDFIRSLMFNPWVNLPLRDNDGTADSVITDIGTVADTIEFTTGAAFVVGHLVRTTGFTTSANNKLARVTTGGATSLVAAGAGYVAEAAPAAAARVKVVGFEGAAADITALADGLGSTALDFTTLGLSVGQWIKIGGTGAAYRFATEACNGFARVTAIAAGKLTLDNLPTGWAADVGTGKTIRVFAGDQVKNGVTRTSLTIERGFMGQTTPTYIAQRGMVVAQAEMNFTSEQVISGSFTISGMTGEQSTTSLDDAPEAATTNAIMSANVNVGRIAEAGATVASPNWIRSLQLRANNNLRMISAVGNVGAVDIGVGDLTVELTLETYFGDNAMLAKLLAGTPSNVNARVTKNSQALIMALPRVTYTGGSPSAGQKNSDVMLPLTGMVSVDELTNAQLIFDRLEYFEA